MDMGNDRRGFSSLETGANIEYDARHLFMDDAQWVQATFLRWLSTFPAKGVYCSGVINRAVLSVDGRELETETVYMRCGRVP
jgi:hypothetical protein